MALSSYWLHSVREVMVQAVGPGGILTLPERPHIGVTRGPAPSQTHSQFFPSIQGFELGPHEKRGSSRIAKRVTTAGGPGRWESRTVSAIMIVFQTARRPPCRAHLHP